MQVARSSKGPIRFGVFEVDVNSGELRKQGIRIKLQEQPFQILQILLEFRGEVVTREELQRRIWPADTFVDFDKGLYSAIKKLRESLGDEAGSPRYIETVPKRGYRFIAPIEEGTLGHGTAHPAPVLVMPAEVAQPIQRTQPRRFPWKTVALALPAFVLLAAGLWYWRVRVAHRLTQKDTVVLGDFDNSTSDAVFDDTLKTALDISLRQSPFLNVLSDGKVAKTLRDMTRPANTKLTPEVAREVCLRAGSKAYIAGSVGRLGSEYVMGLKAVNCQNGDSLAQEQVTAPSKEKVLDTLGDAAAKLRGELGESLASVTKFDVPLAATTPSLDALKAFSLGRKALEEKGPAAALENDQRSIDLDPNFALGYLSVGGDYANLGELGRASGYIAKAFALRDHTSEIERLQISTQYYWLVTGELEKASQTGQELIDIYPREVGAVYANLGLMYAGQGQYDKAADITRLGMGLSSPGQAASYANLANYTLALQKLGESRQIIQDAQARKMDDFPLHSALYGLAFLGGDAKAMAAQQQWFSGRPEETFGLALASDTEAFEGRLEKARETTKLAVDSAIRVDAKETGAIWQAIEAQREAAFGHAAEARQTAEEALKLSPTSQAVQSEAALALAMAGETGRAEALADELAKQYPLDTQIQSLWLPAIRAESALSRNDSAAALRFAQAASPIELGQFQFVNNLSCLNRVYVRGEAYVAAGQGAAAAAEFQEILDHSGIVWNCWTGAVARLGLARANALESKTAHGAEADAARVRALAAYKEFLTLWKDADPDLPLLKQAQAELAKLQSSP